MKKCEVIDTESRGIVNKEKTVASRLFFKSEDEKAIIMLKHVSFASRK